MQGNAYLILENGTVFKGKSFGHVGETMGEVVFTTTMTGYMETLTDPGFCGQLVVQTFPLIGNYGVIPQDIESEKPHLKAYIVRNWCQHPSNFRCEGLLDTFLKENKIVGLYGIDTRALTKIVRDNGSMNAKIASGDTVTAELLEELKGYKMIDAVETVTCKEETVIEANEKKYRVALWDFGAKNSLINSLTKHGCEVVRVPAHTTAECIAELGCDGIVLSGGPGNPTDNEAIIAEIKKAADKKIPMMGVCLGHSLLALSQGAQIEKLHPGHRGANQPSVDTSTGQVYITFQNYGYAVSENAVPSNATVTYKNGNYGTVEGLAYNDIPAFSVQFQPTDSGCSRDTSFLFDKFIALMNGGKN